MIIQVIMKYPHRLLLTLRLFEWLCNMLFHTCQQENCLNETYVRVHVRLTKKSGKQILFNWLMGSDASPRSFLRVSKFLFYCSSNADTFLGHLVQSDNHSKSISLTY